MDAIPVLFSREWRRQDPWRDDHEDGHHSRGSVWKHWLSIETESARATFHPRRNSGHREYRSSRRRFRGRADWYVAELCGMFCEDGDGEDERWNIVRTSPFHHTLCGLQFILTAYFRLESSWSSLYILTLSISSPLHCASTPDLL